MISDDFSFLTAESGRTPQETENNIIKRYEELAGTTLYPADPVRLFLKSLAYTLSVQNAVIRIFYISSRKALILSIWKKRLP